MLVSCQGYVGYIYLLVKEEVVLEVDEHLGRTSVGSTRREDECSTCVELLDWVVPADGVRGLNTEREREQQLNAAGLVRL